MCHAEAKPSLRFAHGFQPLYALHCAPGLARHTQALGNPLIKAILFDLDETLIDRTETMRRFLVAQHGLFPELSGLSCSVYSDACLRHQENGYADKLEAYASACKELELSNTDLAAKLFADFKDRYGTDPVAFPSVLDTLKILQESYKIGLVSNGRTRGQTAKITACGFDSFFSSICISESFGFKKPDERIFMACLNELTVQPSEAVFVGDNPTADIEPAKKLGMFAVWVTNSHFSAPAVCDGTIKNVSELPDLVAGLT